MSLKFIKKICLFDNFQEVLQTIVNVISTSKLWTLNFFWIWLLSRKFNVFYCGIGFKKSSLNWIRYHIISAFVILKPIFDITLVCKKNITQYLKNKMYIEFLSISFFIFRFFFNLSKIITSLNQQDLLRSVQSLGGRKTNPWTSRIQCDHF